MANDISALGRSGGRPVRVAGISLVIFEGSMPPSSTGPVPPTPPALPPSMPTDPPLPVLPVLVPVVPVVLLVVPLPPPGPPVSATLEQ